MQSGNVFICMVSHASDIGFVILEGRNVSSWLFQIKGDGACMFRAVHSQLGFPDDPAEEGPDSSTLAQTYTPYRLRLELVMRLLELCKRVWVCSSCNVWI